MKTYSIQLIFMILGAILPILFRAQYYAGDCFQLWYFVRDNRYRWYLEALILVIIQSLLFFEGDGIIDALKIFGVIVPIISGSTIGLTVSYFIVKLIPTTTLIPPQQKGCDE